MRNLRHKTHSTDNFEQIVANCLGQLCECEPTATESGHDTDEKPVDETKRLPDTWTTPVIDMTQCTRVVEVPRFSFSKGEKPDAAAADPSVQAPAKSEWIEVVAAGHNRPSVARRIAVHETPTSSESTSISFEPLVFGAHITKDIDSMPTVDAFSDNPVLRPEKHVNSGAPNPDEEESRHSAIAAPGIRVPARPATEERTKLEDTAEHSVQRHVEPAAQPVPEQASRTVERPRTSETASIRIPTEVADEPRAAEPVQSVSIDLQASSDERLRVRIAETTTGLRVAVTGGTHDTAERVRAGLPDLVARLDESGFSSEVWTPDQVNRVEYASDLNNSMGRDQSNADMQGRSSDGHPGSRRRQQPQWLADIEEAAGEKRTTW